MRNPDLTPRERDVMALICEGGTNLSIGAHLGLSPRTVEIHRANAIAKLGARNAVHAAVMFSARERNAP